MNDSINNKYDENDPTIIQAFWAGYTEGAYKPKTEIKCPKKLFFDWIMSNGTGAITDFKTNKHGDWEYKGYEDFILIIKRKHQNYKYEWLLNDGENWYRTYWQKGEQDYIIFRESDKIDLYTQPRTREKNDKRHQ